MVEVVAGQGADAEVGQELARIERAAQQTFHAMPTQQRKQPPFAASRLVPT